MSAPAEARLRPQPLPRRPDIVLLRSVRDSFDTIRDELKEIGTPDRYQMALRVIRTQAKLIADLSGELLERFEKAADLDGDGGGQ
jgi:hypothetical protein